MRSTTNQISLLATILAGSICLPSCSRPLCTPSEADGQIRFSASTPGMGVDDVFAACLEAGGDPNSIVETGDNMNGWTPLLLTAHGGFGDATRQRNDSLWNSASLEQIRLLLEHGADLQARTPEGENAVYLSAVAGRVPLIELFLAKGLPVDEVTSTGKTPLFGSITYGRTDVVELLLKRGANPNHISAERESVLDYAEGVLRAAEHAGAVSAPGYEPLRVIEILKKNGAKTAQELGRSP